MQRAASSVVVLSALLVLLPEAAGAQEYLVERLPPLGFLGNTRAEGLNDAGQAIGHSNTDTLQLAPALWEDGTAVNLTPPGLGMGRAFGISEGGIVAGNQADATGKTRATVWVRGAPVFLDGLAGDFGATAGDANDDGVVAGWVTTASTLPQAVRWVDGTIETIAGLDSFAFGVNGNGTIIGRRAIAAVQEAFLFDAGDAAGRERIAAMRWTPSRAIVEHGRSVADPARSILRGRDRRHRRERGAARLPPGRLPRPHRRDAHGRLTDGAGAQRLGREPGAARRGRRARRVRRAQGRPEAGAGRTRAPDPDPRRAPVRGSRAGRRRRDLFALFDQALVDKLANVLGA